jgi:excisionase family DNA binding protein
LTTGGSRLSSGTKEVGFCDLHEELADEVTYRYKGCWGSQHFEFSQTFPYLFVSEAAEELMVSESTIRRLINKGKLEGEPAKYHFSKESLREYLEGKPKA